MKTCPNCGSQVEDNQNTCPYCSYNFNNPQETASFKQTKTLSPYKRSLSDDEIVKAIKAKLYGDYGFTKNIDEAYELAEEAANRGIAEGMYYFGLLLKEKGEDELAIKYWTLAARKGDEQSRIRLFIESGKSVSPVTATPRQTTIIHHDDVDDNNRVEEYPTEDVINSTVMVLTKVSSGTGFVVEGGYIATNAHVVEGYEEASVFFYEDIDEKNKVKVSHKTRVIARYDEYDIAILQFVKGDDRAKYLIRAVKHTDEYQTREHVQSLGYPQGHMFTYDEGIIANAKCLPRNYGGKKFARDVKDYIQINFSCNNGNSGGPLFNKRNEVIGIINARPSKSNGGIAYAIPYRYINLVLETIK